MTRTSLILDVVGVLLVGAALALRQWVGAGVPDVVYGLLYGLGVGALVGSLLHLRFARTCDMSTPAQRSRYLRDAVPVGVGYVLAMVVSVLALRQVEGPAWRAAIALLPVPFVALLLRAMVRHIRDADELQRRIEVEAVSFAAAAVCLVYFAGGLLQAARVIALPASIAMLWVFPLTCLLYGVAKIVVFRRYA